MPVCLLPERSRQPLSPDAGGVVLPAAHVPLPVGNGETAMAPNPPAATFYAGLVAFVSIVLVTPVVSIALSSNVYSANDCANVPLGSLVTCALACFESDRRRGYRANTFFCNEEVPSDSLATSFVMDTVHAMYVSVVIVQHRIFSAKRPQIVQCNHYLLRSDLVALQMTMVIVNVQNPIV